MQIAGGKNITAYTGTWSPGTYYFNVVVADLMGNKAVYITKELTITAAEIISVSVSPATINVAPGGTQQFTATVNAAGGADESVTWSISGQTSMLTSISAVGLLTIGANDIADTIIVIATSDFDKGIAGTAVVTVGDVGIVPIPTNQLQIYPNPTTGQLRISNYELRDDTVIELFDVVGKCYVSRVTCNEIIDISHLANGMYFLKIDGKVFKVVKE
jgi:hypothetical protein